MPESEMGRDLESTLTRLVAGVLHPAALPADQWAPLVALAAGQGLAPFLYWRLRAAGLALGGEPFSTLTRLAHQAAILDALQAKLQGEAEAALVSAGVPALWIKGRALAGTVYPEPWLRPMADIDVLVPYEQRELAQETLLRLGLQVPDFDYAQMVAMPEPLHHHYALHGGPGGALLLELHFRLLGKDGANLLPLDELAWFWSQTRQLVSAAGRFAILKSEAHLLYLSTHALLQHGEAYIDLLHYLDLHLLVEGEEIDWALLVDRAIHLGWTYPLKRALERAAHYFGTSLPGWVPEALGGRDARAEQVAARAIRLQSQVLRWEEWRQIAARKSPWERLRFLWRTVFPTAEFVRRLYRLAPGERVYPAYLRRWQDAAREIFRVVSLRFTDLFG
ncbi:MAG TPA: nucleotidyltransferase family protein [Anaerolineales bacterium]|nr:nucleotidyltransferase family protein [Anaerolineales bacterium]